MRFEKPAATEVAEITTAESCLPSPAPRLYTEIRPGQPNYEEFRGIEGLQCITEPSSDDVGEAIALANHDNAVRLQELVGVERPDVPVTHMREFLAQLNLTSSPVIFFEADEATLTRIEDNTSKELVANYRLSEQRGNYSVSRDLALVAVDRSEFAGRLPETTLHELTHSGELSPIDFYQASSGELYYAPSDRSATERLCRFWGEGRAEFIAAHYRELFLGNVQESQNNIVPAKYLHIAKDGELTLSASSYQAAVLELLIACEPELFDVVLSPDFATPAAHQEIAAYLEAINPEVRAVLLDNTPRVAGGPRRNIMELLWHTNFAGNPAAQLEASDFCTTLFQARLA